MLEAIALFFMTHTVAGTALIFLATVFTWGIVALGVDEVDLTALLNRLVHTGAASVLVWAVVPMAASFKISLPELACRSVHYGTLGVAVLGCMSALRVGIGEPNETR